MSTREIFDAHTVTAAQQEYALDRAINGLRDDDPRRSASKPLLGWQKPVLLSLLAIVIAVAVWQPMVTAIALIGLCTLAYLLTLGDRVLIFRRGLASRPIVIPDEVARSIPDDELPAYTILVPAYNEPEVVADLIGAMDSLEYPRERLQVLLLLEADDQGTIDAARACGESDVITILLVPPAEPRTKPKACNYGLHFATGEIVTIFDAEDLPEPLQLRRVVAAFRDLPDDVACVQAKLVYHNGHQNLLTAWFTAEYGLWFGFLLPGMMVSTSPIPLGGTSNHLRRDMLQGIGGWDPFNVTEDADLGLRIAASGYHTAVIDSYTLEEANSDPINWIRQRSRWYKGYLQTWLVHIRRPVKLYRTLGLRSFIRFTLVLAGTPIIAVLNLLFWFITLLWFLGQPAVVGEVFPDYIYFPALVAMIIGNFTVMYMNMIALREDDRSDLLVAGLTVALFWLMMSVAAAKGCYQMIRQPSFWEKTFHGLAERPDDSTVHQSTGQPMTVALGGSDRRLKFSIFFLGLVVYIAVGYWLQIQNGFIMGDTLSRVSSTRSVLFSRDPHLAALGFIFTPVAAMVQIPAVWLSPLFPEITARAFSGTLMSALFMSGAAVQIFSMGADRGLPRSYSLTITALFALNPMIVFYGSNGMSEAPFIFFMTWAVRRLIMWMVDDDVHHLVAAGGVAMGLAYLTRYDALATVGAAGLVVGITTYLRARPAPRVHRAVMDMLIVSGPGIAAFLGWAAAGWLITGEAFAQFTSQYGNAAILEQSGMTAPNTVEAVSFAAACIMFLAPTLLPLTLWALMQRWGRPNWQMLVVPLAMFGAVLAFQALSYAQGSTFPFLRFFIIAIPMAATLALLGVPDGVFARPKRRGKFAPAVTEPARQRRSAAPYMAVASTLAIGIPVTVLGMSLPDYAPQEYGLAAVLAPDPDDVTERAATEQRIARTFGTERRIADYLETLDLPDSSVITDTVYGFGIIAASPRPRVFVIPSDPDFTELLNDPAGNGIRYLLSVPPTGRGSSDALNLRYPTLYDTGAEIASLELEIPNDGDGQPDWRLYRIAEPSDSG